MSEKKDLKSLRIVMIGPPGGGKGTQARLLQEEIGVAHISTGEIFRRYARAGTELGLRTKALIDKGLLVPDDLTLEIMEDRLFGGDDDNNNLGCILDGFPRTVPQAKVFEDILNKHNAKIDFVININVPNEYIIERITGRFSCAKCGEMYHDKFKKPKLNGICDVCGGTKFVRRVDDTVDVVQKRLNEYRELTEPLLPFYKSRALLHSVDGVGDIKDIAASVKKVVGVE